MAVGSRIDIPNYVKVGFQQKYRLNSQFLRSDSICRNDTN